MHGPDEIDGAEDAEVTIMFEATRIEMNSWVRDEIEQEIPPKSEVVFLSIDFETGGWELVLTPLVLPPRDSGYAEALTGYGARARMFVQDNTEEILDFLKDRARQKGVV